MGSIVGPLLVLVSFALLPDAGPLAFLAVLSLAILATILTVFFVWYDTTFLSILSSPWHERSSDNHADPHVPPPPCVVVWQCAA